MERLKAAGELPNLGQLKNEFRKLRRQFGAAARRGDSSRFTRDQAQRLLLLDQQLAELDQDWRRNFPSDLLTREVKSEDL